MIASCHSPLTVVVSLTTGAAATVGRAGVGRARGLVVALVTDPLERATVEATVAVTGRLSVLRVFGELAIGVDLIVSDEFKD